MALYDNATYTVRVSVKNKSTKGGVPVAVSILVGGYCTAGSSTIVTWTPTLYNFLAGETRVIDFSFFVPAVGDTTGEMKFSLKTPEGVEFKSAVQSLTYLSSYVPPPPQQFYTCPICGASFNSPYELNLHMASYH